jgi:hypothetical protein
MSGRIRGVGCLSHPVHVRLGTSVSSPPSDASSSLPTYSSEGGGEGLDPNAAFVELASEELLDGGEEGDIVLTLDCEGLDEPRCFVEWTHPTPSSNALKEAAADDAEGQDAPPVPSRTEAYALTFVPSANLPSPSAQGAHHTSLITPNACELRRLNHHRVHLPRRSVRFNGGLAHSRASFSPPNHA